MSELKPFLYVYLGLITVAMFLGMSACQSEKPKVKRSYQLLLKAGYVYQVIAATEKENLPILLRAEDSTGTILYQTPWVIGTNAMVVMADIENAYVFIDSLSQPYNLHMKVVGKR